MFATILFMMMQGILPVVNNQRDLGQKGERLPMKE